jgi:hypothetical protein
MFMGPDFRAESGKHVWRPSLTSNAMPVNVTEITKESDSGYPSVFRFTNCRLKIVRGGFFLRKKPPGI